MPLVDITSEEQRQALIEKSITAVKDQIYVMVVEINDKARAVLSKLVEDSEQTMRIESNGLITFDVELPSAIVSGEGITVASAKQDLINQLLKYIMNA